MVKQFVPRDKMSEKQKKKTAQSKRVTWTMNPVTRIKPSGKIYDRRKYKTNAYGE